MLRQVKVNIPLLDMIKQVSTYAKFLKDLCTVKRGLCDAPNPAPGVKRGCHFFFFYKLITFKIFRSYNVKHLTCIIFYSSGLQNIYKLHICSTFTKEMFNIYNFTLFTKESKTTYTKIYQMVFQWAPSDVLALTADADCLVLWFPLLYLHG